jgi:hypothetical protein
MIWSSLWKRHADAVTSVEPAWLAHFAVYGPTFDVVDAYPYRVVMLPTGLDFRRTVQVLWNGDVVAEGPEAAFQHGGMRFNIGQLQAGHRVEVRFKDSLEPAPGDWLFYAARWEHVKPKE